jgi:hypothetical protein
MVGWLEDHVAAVGPLNLNSGLMDAILVKLETGRGP